MALFTSVKILDEILDYDSSSFIDEKREDFQIKKEDVISITTDEEIEDII